MTAPPVGFSRRAQNPPTSVGGGSVWSHTGKITESISGGLFKYFDLFHIVDPKQRKDFPGEEFIVTHAEIFFNHEIGEETLLSFDTEVKPLTSSHLVPSGEYEVCIRIGSADAKTINKSIYVNHSGKWHKNEPNMLSTGISIKL